MSSEITSSRLSRNVEHKKDQASLLRVSATAALLGISFAGGLSHAHAYSESQFRETTSEEEANIDRVRQQEIDQLKIVLGRRFSETRRPDILLRLAELYIERYRFFFFKENEIHQNLYKQGQRPRSVNHDRSRGALNAATNSCLAILKSKVSFSKMDQVYYFLGYNAEELGHKKDAIKYFTMVVRNFSNSSYAPEAYRNLAEHAFTDKKYNQAVTYYERAASYTKVPSYPRTLYKLAWAYFKVRRRGEALNVMKRVIDATGSADKFVGLRDEALGDLVMFFAEAGRFSDAKDYFSRISNGPEVYVKALGKLSSAYERRGDNKLAIKVNDTLVAEHGDDRPDLVVEMLAKNVEIYRKLNDHEGEEAALGKLVKFFGEHGREISKNEASQATFSRTKNYLRSRATEVHKEAQKKKSNALYLRAADLYGLYSRAFLSSPENDKERRERSEIRIYRADSWLAAGREADAIPELEATLKDDGAPQYRKEAGTTLLNLLIKRLDAQMQKGGRADSAMERRFMDASEAFERAFPDDKLVVELRYKKARLAAGKSGPEGLSGDARSALRDLVAQYPSRPEAVDAAHDLVNDAIKRKDMAEASRLAQAYLENAALLRADKKDSLEKYLRSILSRESFKNVQELEKDQDFAKAAAEYERLATSRNADAEVAAKALNNAAVSYEKAGQIDEAVRIYQQMAAKNPKSSAPREELKRMASQYLWTSRFAESARLYAKLSNSSLYSTEERLSFARLAFSLYWGMSDHGNAFLVANQAIGSLCGSSGCHDLDLESARLQIEAGRAAEALTHLRGYLNKRIPNLRKAEANFMIAELYKALHEDRKALVYLEEATRSVARNKKGTSGTARERNFAARAAFELVEPYFQKFASIKIELPEERLKAQTKSKLDQLEGLVTRYLNVVNYGDGEWGIAALERLYDVFSSFSNELERAPIPPKFEGEKREAYQRGIRSVTQPMAERAYDYLKQGHTRGLQLHVATPTFQALTQRLAKRNPREFPAAHYSMGSELRLMGIVANANAEDLKKSDRPERREIARKLTQSPKNADVWVEFGNLEAMAGRPKLARLLYEQALSLNARHAGALNNISVLLVLENKPLEALQGFMRAVEIAEFNKDARMNLARTQLGFHHFSSAVENLRALVGRFPEDKEVAEAYAVALLGAAQLSSSGAKLKELNAKDSNRFNQWYNWSVWATLSGTNDDKEDAVDLIKSRMKNLGALEKSQAELALAIGQAAKGGQK